MRRVGQPSQVQILKAAFRARQADIRTACPGIVVDYDAPTQTATINLAVRLPDVNGVPQELPPLSDVVVKWPRGGGFFATMPLQPGDTGLLVFCEADFSGWRQSGEVSDATQERRHGLYPYFLPGGADDTKPLVSASADHMVCGQDGGPVIRIKSTGIELGAAATDFVALAGLVKTELDAIQSKFDAHVHPVTALGSPTGPTPTSIGSLGAVAATKVKAQ